MKFRIWTILWVFALFASALATFGIGGILPSLMVIAIWMRVALRRSTILVGMMLGVLVFVVLLLVLLPSVSTPRAVVRRATCANNMKQLALALLNYHSSFGKFPAARQSLPKSEYYHSWRMWIYPFVESSNFYDSYRKYEAWDSVFNRRLVNQSGVSEFSYQCPAHMTAGQPHAHYLAVAGNRTMWPPDQGRTISEISDGSANTIMLIEASHKSVEWAKPADLDFDEAVELLSSNPGDNFGHRISYGFFYKPKRGINVAFVDGSVQFIELPISRATAVALLTMDGGEEVDRLDFRSLGQPEIDYARIYSLSVFVLLTLLPAVNLRKKKQNEQSEAA